MKEHENKFSGFVGLFNLRCFKTATEKAGAQGPGIGAEGTDAGGGWGGQSPLHQVSPIIVEVVGVNGFPNDNSKEVYHARSTIIFFTKCR